MTTVGSHRLGSARASKASETILPTPQSGCTSMPSSSACSRACSSGMAMAQAIPVASAVASR